NVEINPKDQGKEQIKAIQLRSGKELEPQIQKEQESQKEEVEIEKETDQQNLNLEHPLIPMKITVEKPPPPFPQRLKQHKKDKQFSKFIEILKKLIVNILFVEALEQMPNYVKFMKDI
ncbi:hypothetical protein, partial [Pseudomonas aeruginosa]|uniref:hypothetical protein n=1 Tax=Pseudomonas aeruginosa TaxID=287 RepID=UPI003EB8F8C3